MVKVSDIIAEFLKENEIEVVFGIIGSANAHIFDSITNLGYTEIVCVHHEQAAVMAMGAYFRTSGKLSASIVTAGAGASNAITGVLSNWADSIPGIIISGQESTMYLTKHSKLRMLGTQGFDAAGMVSNITKYSTSLNAETDTQEVLEKSLYETMSGRKGPVWIDVPFDIQSKVIEFRPWNFIKEEDTYINDIDEVVDLLTKSKQPLILGGNGVRLSDSKKEFNELVNISKIPTLLTWSAIDLLPNSSEYNFGRFGIYGQRCANFIVQNCDLLLILGSRLTLPQIGYDSSQFARKAKIILIDIDNDEIIKYEDRCHKTILTDCKSFINELLTKLVVGDYSEWLLKCKTTKEDYPLIEGGTHDDNGYVNSYKFIDSISDRIPSDSIIVTDMGTALLSGHQNIKLKKDQLMFTSLGLGEMGYGLPGAIGASFTDRNRDVVCLNCDGGIMMNLQELQTIIHYNLPIKIIIFNNDGYLMIKHTQKMLFNGKYTNVNKDTNISLPDYQKLGQSLGYPTYSIKNWDEFNTEWDSFIKLSGPAICEVFMDPEQGFEPKVKGVVKDDGTIFAPPIEEMSPLLPIDIIEKEMGDNVSYKSKEIKR